MEVPAASDQRQPAVLAEEAANDSVALVLPGGGARGAYEIGALSVLLPRLEDAGERVTIFCGTSVGAINAALLASLAHLPAREAMAAAVDVWRGLRYADVFARFAGIRALINGLRLVGESAFAGRPAHRGLVDPGPLRGGLDQWVSWRQLAANVRSGAVDAACLLATRLADDLPTAFVACDPARELHVTSEQIRYVRAQLGPDHALASAAIPVLFAPVRVAAPRQAAGYYVDGATRINTPLKPALDLGAQRLIVIGYEPLTAARRAKPRSHVPQLADVAANVLDGLLLDQVNSDLRRMAAINVFFAARASGIVDPAHTRSAEVYRRARGRRPYRRIQYAIVSPRRRRELGRIAERSLRAGRGDLASIVHPDMLLLRGLLGAASDSRGELLSFLMFDESYVAALIDAGRRDARRWLRRHPRFWCADPAHDFGYELGQRITSNDDATSLDEWRQVRRLPR